MGNCVPKQASRSSPGVADAESPDAVRVYGSESCPVALRIRIALLYKTVPVRFNRPESPPAAAAVGRPLIWCGGETVTGTEEALLQFVDSRFPQKPAAKGKGMWSSPSAEVAVASALQHRSMERHLEGMAADLMASGGGGGEGNGSEARKLEERYAQIGLLMLEHTQMEELLIFPAMESAANRVCVNHRDDAAAVCKAASEEHARDLPIVNGIREDLKAFLAMEVGTLPYKEALLNLYLRFQTLQRHYKQHFAEEEIDLQLLLRMVERARKEEGIDSSGWVGEMMEVMETTHSQHFSFFMAGLRPQEAMQYLDLVCRRTPDQQRLVMMLQSLAASLEGQRPPFIDYGNPSNLND